MMGFLFYAPGARADDTGWLSQAFAGSRVSVVTANPSNPGQVAAVANNQLKVTWDGGIIWRDTNLSAPTNVIAFDPVYPGVIYAGTNTGVYKSTDVGLTWSPFGNAASRALIVLGLTANKDGIFSTENNGAGSSLNVFKFDRLGNTSWVAFPDTNAGHLYTDPQTSYMYVASRNAVYRSTDAGSTWSVIGATGQIGLNSLRVYAKGSEVWQLANKGVWHTSNQGASWQALADNLSVPDLALSASYGIGLAVNRGNAFFNVRHDSFNIFSTQKAGSGLVPSSLGYIAQKPLDLTISDDSLWLATETGLLVRRGLTVNEAQVQRPVVVVPGILGSWQVAGKWILEPFTGSYDPLLSMLRNAGYSDDQTLFTFPYQWRQDNHISAAQLGEKIAQVRNICLCPEVDVIGHSMGGLVARAYVQSSNYNNDVNNLILLGTPNAGSVDNYSIWEAGKSSSPHWFFRLLTELFVLEAYENSYTNLRDYVRADVNSVAQLLPNHSYIVGRSYPNGYPVNTFLDTLNSPAGLALLKSRVNVVIAGSDSLPTLTQLEVGAETGEPDWPHGEIITKIYGGGDDTVTASSLTAIGGLDLAMSLNHGDLTKRPSSSLLAHLLGGPMQIASVTEAESDMLLLYVKSPVRLSITDPSGRGVNDINNEVPNAFYTGSDELVQFMTIPNFGHGKYRINLSGKCNGVYTVGASVIAVDPAGDKNVELQYQTVTSQQDQLVYDTETNLITLVSSAPPSTGSGSIGGGPAIESETSGEGSPKYFGTANAISLATAAQVEGSSKTAESSSKGANGFGWHILLLIAVLSAIISVIWAHRRKRK